MSGKNMLEENGIKVTRAQNGQKAVDHFQQSSLGYYDMILMDIMMPVMDGLEATKKIQNLPREDAKKVPIVAMTANAYESDKKMSMDAGMCSHLSKPIKREKLIEVLNRFLS